MDEHDLHRHDDDGYVQHAHLHRQAKKRFMKAAKAYCEAWGTSGQVGTMDRLRDAMLSAYDVLKHS